MKIRLVYITCEQYNKKLVVEFCMIVRVQCFFIRLHSEERKRKALKT